MTVKKLTDFAHFYNEIMPIARDMISEKRHRIHKELEVPASGVARDKDEFDKYWDLSEIDGSELTLSYSDPIFGDDEEYIPFWAFEDKENWYEQCVAIERAARRAADDINREIRKKSLQDQIAAAQKEYDRLNNPDA